MTATQQHEDEAEEVKKEEEVKEEEEEQIEPTKEKEEQQGEDDESDWEYIDENGECTSYEPTMPYTTLFGKQDSKVENKDFERLQLLGKGAMGVVCLVRYRRDGKHYALKEIRKRNVTPTSSGTNSVVRERDIMKKLAAGSKFLVRMHFCFQSQSKLYFALDYMAGGNLYKYTSTLPGGKVSERASRHMSAQIYLGLQFLHGNGIVYRDLKPENILLTELGNAKLSDFGISKQLDTDDRTGSFCGSYHYLAPEIISGKRYSCAVDWWSFGVVIYNLLTGENPFVSRAADTLMKKIVNKPVKFFEPVGDIPRDLILRLLMKDESQRIGGSQIPLHPWFVDLDWESVYSDEPAPDWNPPTSIIIEEKASKMVGHTLGDNSLPFAGFTGAFDGFSCDNRQALT
eukprot:TRINITY_DN10591_c0_g1_i1.p1 TRINITY_DN10591_c0_g1~~TRINITY_DN10591_c0_g1_i1.p1  ORF type:complete len:400 (+),score=81.30 TRINITY_DN10591_c0_g1_i1:38-1237(+)